jgi:thioredoxin-like negative regulator of GroEL
MDVKTFKSLAQSKEKSIVILSASWCSPCKVLGKTVDKIKESAPSLAKKIHKVDVDDASELATELKIQSVPTVFYLGDGEPRIETGLQTEAELCTWFLG